MKIYAVHTKLVETDDVKYMLSEEKFPRRAVYGDFYLFAEPHPQPSQPVVDMTLIEDIEEFEAAYLELMQEEHTGRWIHLNKDQGRFLKNKYYPDTNLEVDVQ